MKEEILADFFCSNLTSDLTGVCSSLKSNKSIRIYTTILHFPFYILHCPDKPQLIDTTEQLP